MPYLMTIDMGNSDVSIGVFGPDDKSPRAKWRIGTRSHRTKDEYGLLIEGAARHYGFDTADICHIVVSCVVPLALKPLLDGCKEYLGITPLVVGQGVKTGIDIKYGSKGELTTDRVANMSAAFRQFPSGVVVIDCGTLISLDVVDGNGVYKGGNILPGPLLMHQALVEAVPRIPEVPRGTPYRVLGTDLMESIQNGVFYAVAGALNMMLDAYRAQHNIRLPVIATGGFAPELVEYVAFDHIEPDLTLIGLKQIYDKNRQPDGAATQRKKENG
ncbi:MAG: type III pantothenate kinase [Proteobacteria bacterium]|nr:type III pantothenate kinase [Pseudomonadota bacterium]